MTKPTLMAKLVELQEENARPRLVLEATERWLRLNGYYTYADEIKSARKEQK